MGGFEDLKNSNASQGNVGKGYTLTHSATPLQTVGCFPAEVQAGGHSTTADFVVIEAEVDALLSKDTAQALGFLKIGLGINVVQFYM